MRGLFVLLQYLLPHHLLSRALGFFGRSRWLKAPLIAGFRRLYGVDLTEAISEQASAYESFNAFFTRRLKPEARPLPSEDRIAIVPADGVVSQLGRIDKDRLLQAKGKWFSTLDLLGGDETLAARYRDGSFATVYLSPSDYHRVHMPISGELLRTVYVPGRLFSVNPTTTAAVSGLFARNERLICEFETDSGPMVVVLVGAMIVASIEVAWAGQVTPRRGNRPETRRFDQAPAAVKLATGEELGLFKLGSTVITLFSAGAISLDKALVAGARVRMGQILGELEPR